MAQGKARRAALMLAAALGMALLGCKLPAALTGGGEEPPTPTAWQTAGPQHNPFGKARGVTPPAESATPTPSETPPTQTPGTPTLQQPTEESGSSAAPSATPAAPSSGGATAIPTAILNPGSTPTQTVSFTQTAPATNTPISVQPTTTPRATTNPSSCAATQNAEVETRVAKLVNDRRVAQGLPTLAAQPALGRAAAAHSRDMACNNFYGPTGSDGSNVADRLRAQGYNQGASSQLIYAGTGNANSADAAVNSWMGKAQAMGILLSSNFTEFGVGYALISGATYEGYYTIVIAKPAQ